MPQVSKHPLSNDIYKRIFDIFIKSLISLKTKSKANDFLNSFLTETERVMLAKRLSIAFLLDENYDYRSISEILKVSTSTVRNVSNQIKNDESFNKTVQIIKKDEYITTFFDNIASVITSTLAKVETKSGVWKHFDKELSKKFDTPF